MACGTKGFRVAVFLSDNVLHVKENKVYYDERVQETYSLQALETWVGTVYLQSMIMVRVSLSLASWKGGCPHTSMKRITPRLQISDG